MTKTGKYSPSDARSGGLRQPQLEFCLSGAQRGALRVTDGARRDGTNGRLGQPACMAVRRRSRKQDKVTLAKPVNPEIGPASVAGPGTVSIPGPVVLTWGGGGALPVPARLSAARSPTPSSISPGRPERLHQIHVRALLNLPSKRHSVVSVRCALVLQSESNDYEVMNNLISAAAGGMEYLFACCALRGYPKKMRPQHAWGH